MDFGLTAEQELLRRTARDVMRTTAPTSWVRAMLRDERGITPEAWRRMAELGWQGLVFPPDHGGAGLTLIELAIVLEEMGRAVLPGPFLSTVIAGLALLYGGDEAERARWLPGICDGSRVATLALLEASACWDPAAITAVARRAGGEAVLSGRKLFVPDAHLADLVLCAVRRAEDGTLALVAVEREPAGLVLEEVPSVDRTRRVFAVTLDGVRVRPGDVLAADAAGALARVLDAGRVALAAEMCGGAERVLELTVEHAKARRQFGQPIGAFQAIQHACADMMVAVECARVATCHAAWAVAQGAGDAALAAAMAKATASEAYRHVTAQAIQVHGGIGFTWEHDLQLYYKRALSSDVTFGDAAWSRERVAQLLGL